jgi:hypothetical protein
MVEQYVRVEKITVLRLITISSLNLGQMGREFKLWETFIPIINCIGLNIFQAFFLGQNVFFHSRIQVSELDPSGYNLYGLERRKKPDRTIQIPALVFSLNFKFNKSLPR